MRLMLFVLLLCAAAPARALDLCPAYRTIHDRVVVEKVRSGIPFKLLGIATDGNATFRRIVHVEFNLWDEKLTVETLGGQRVTCTLAQASEKICQALSFPEVPAGRAYRYQLLLNPVLGDKLSRLKENGGKGAGLLQVNWQRLAKDLETERVLLDEEVAP